jgi:hypothetical protein
MSMKWVRCLNHMHTPSETPSESPTTATLTVRLVRPSIYQVRVTPLWLLAAVDGEGAETLYIYIWTRPVMSMMWMGCLNHNLQLNPSETPSESPTAISRWVCILMTTGCSSRCWNALYIYELDLLWVWTGWGASIITCIIIQVRNQENHLPLPVTVRPSISGWGCILMTASRSRRCKNTSYVNGKDLMRVWSVWGASVITYSMIQVNLLLLWLWIPSDVSLWLHPYDHWPQ